jgi:transcriptional regulator with XRE-family HTH domain
MAKTARRLAPGRHALSDQLRDVIHSRGLTAYAVARDAGVDPGMVSRFLTGERDIRLATADRIALALNVRLVEVGRAKGRASREAATPGGAIVRP